MEAERLDFGRGLPTTAVAHVIALEVLGRGLATDVGAHVIALEDLGLGLATDVGAHVNDVDVGSSAIASNMMH
jgi:hypothetical protein